MKYGPITMVVSGMAPGPDKLGLIYAKERGLHIAEFPADWKKYPKAAGPIRNAEMGKFADAAIIMWDGKSNGSKHMSEVMKEHGKPFILDIFEPVVYNYVHQPNGIIKRVVDGHIASLDNWIS